LAGLAYAWGWDRDPLEPYYEAAVRSMSMSWHDFIFGAFDPAGTLSLDKLPGAFWVQALAVRVFGFHTWAMVLPQVLEGVLTVVVLYWAVERLAGPIAGLLAAFVLALSPATVALNRGNISDSLMILLVVLAAERVSKAIVTGNMLLLVAAGVLVGLAFQAKMIEAWLVLPALAVAYLMSGPGSAGRRARQLVGAGAVAAVVSLSWMTLVMAVPSSQRPYVDGSSNDSTYSQVFVYNGFGRFGDQTPLQVLAGQDLGLKSVLTVAPVAPNRLLRGSLGLDGGWLIPAAVVLTGWGLINRRRAPPGDRLRACLVLWGGWLVMLGVVFSVTTTINSYYLAALSPAVAALLGCSVAGTTLPDGRGIAPRATLSLVVAGTCAYAAWLLAASGSNVPEWLVPAVVVVGLASIGLAVGSVGRRRSGLYLSALVVGVVAVSLAPVVASAELVAHNEGAFDTPFESAAAKNGIDALNLQIPAQVKLGIARLESITRGAPYLLATQTAAVASVFIDASGREVLPIGGFDGSIPSPTLRQLKADIHAGKFHLVLAATSTDPRLQWIAAHCLGLPSTTAGLHAYYCIRTDTG
jgi:4-amino-4-deoxy-L-arabinose transferase-like glycosyltransferase